MAAAAVGGPMAAGGGGVPAGDRRLALAAVAPRRVTAVGVAAGAQTGPRLECNRGGVPTAAGVAVVATVVAMAGAMAVAAAGGLARPCGAAQTTQRGHMGTSRAAPGHLSRCGAGWTMGLRAGRATPARGLRTVSGISAEALLTGVTRTKGRLTAGAT